MTMSVIEARETRVGAQGRRGLGPIAGIISALLLLTAAIVANVQTDSETTGTGTTKSDRIVSLVNRGLVPEATLQPAPRLDDDLQRLKGLVNRGVVPGHTLEP
jgi:hypothetical protein